ncbi:MAG TPA: FeoA family protein, partial [Anaerolineales bacterium]|nr:FeoA family protein [Anaerolineales bacterium]
PIPTKDGHLPSSDGFRLCDLPTHTPAKVLRVADSDPELLRYLAELGIRPDTLLTIQSRAPFNDLLHVSIAGAEPVPLGHTVTHCVWVKAYKTNS